MVFSFSTTECFVCVCFACITEMNFFFFFFFFLNFIFIFFYFLVGILLFAEYSNSNHDLHFVFLLHLMTLETKLTNNNDYIGGIVSFKTNINTRLHTHTQSFFCSIFFFLKKRRPRTKLHYIKSNVISQHCITLIGSKNVSMKKKNLFLFIY